MDLRHLRYFVAVAEALHFTRAAERLGIKQPPLSLQIRQLEEELGTALFHRMTRGVQLTESGALLLDEARRILDQVERAKAIVQSRGRGESGRIRVGFGGSTYFHPLVPGVIGAFRRQYPNVILAPEQSNTPRLVAGLHGGEIDLAFVRPPVSNSEGLGTVLLVEESMLVVLPAAHALAQTGAIPITAIAEDTLILFPRLVGPGLYDAIVAACQREGFSPTLGQEAPQLASIVHMVAAGFGVSIVPQSIRQIHTEGVAYVPIQGEAPRAPISLAYRRNDQSAAVRGFVAIARQHRRVAS